MHDELLEGWPAGAAVILRRLDGGVIRDVATAGDVDAVRPWASISKMAVGLAFGIEVDWETHTFEEGFGPLRVPAAELLSHVGGYGLEEDDAVHARMTERRYSNYGYDLLVNELTGGGDGPAGWLNDRLFRPLGMTTTTLDGRPSAGLIGSTRDLSTLADAYLTALGVSTATRDRLIRPYAPSLAGIVPGWGRFDPCPWGLGPEVRGSKSHWMGEWPEDSVGHFGKSGALCLLNVREGIAVVATSTTEFGPWATALWPSWTTRVRELILRA